MGFRVLSFGASSRMQYPRACGAVARYLRRERIDVIQAHLLDACVVGLAAARLARTRVKIFTAHHSHEVPLHSRQGLSVVDRLAAGRLADAVIAPSEQMKQTLVSHHRLPAGRVHVIHHGFDLEGLDPERVEGVAVSQELGLESKVVLTSIGRLYWIKNQENLVRAFAALDLPETVLLLAGGGEGAALAELVRSLGLRGAGPPSRQPSRCAGAPGRHGSVCAPGQSGVVRDGDPRSDGDGYSRCVNAGGNRPAGRRGRRDRISRDRERPDSSRRTPCNAHSSSASAGRSSGRRPGHGQMASPPSGWCGTTKPSTGVWRGEPEGRPSTRGWRAGMTGRTLASRD